jgi:hypothetical protein
MQPVQGNVSPRIAKEEKRNETKEMRKGAPKVRRDKYSH